MRVLIIGAGGHGKTVADALQQAHQAGAAAAPIGFLDDDERLHGRQIAELPVLGALGQMSFIAHDGVVVALGDNARRREVFERLACAEARLVTVRHPSAVIGAGVHVGEGAVILAGVVVNRDTRIGRNTILNTSCSVDHDCVVADHVHVAPGAHIGGEVVIDCEALIGLGAVVLPQCRIGAKAIVGAAACVTRSVPAEATVVGIPARPLVCR